MKKTSIFTMIALLAGVFSVDASTVTYSYADGNVSNYGLQRQQRYDVAMLINSPLLQGKKITNIKAYISTEEGVGDCSIWLTKELNLEGKDNIVSIGSYPVSPVAAQYKNQNVGLLSYDFSTPYEYDGSELYVGYSIDLSEADVNNNYKLQNPILVESGVNPNGFFIHGTKMPLTWADYSERNNCVAIIEVEFEGDFPQNSLSISAVDFATAVINEPFNINYYIVNTGSSDVESLTLTYELAGEQVTREINLKSPIPANPALQFAQRIDGEAVSEAARFPITVSIEKVNGETNESSFNSATGAVGVFPYVINNRPLVEEWTGMWCGNCPYGFTTMEDLGEKYDDSIVIVAYHNGDPLMVTSTYPLPNNSYPRASINRKEWLSMGGSTLTPVYNEVEKEQAQTTICEIELTDLSLDGNNLTFSTSTVFNQDIFDSPYLVGYILTANGCTNPNWAQENYFRGVASLANTYLQYWVTAPAQVYGLVYNDVAVGVGGMNGVSESLPSEIEFNTPYISSFTLPCKNIVSTYNNQIIPFDLADAVINFYVVNPQTREILNANKFRLGDNAAVKSIKAENADIIETIYYNLNGIKIDNPANGIFIKSEKLSNGEIKTSKIAIK